MLVKIVDELLDRARAPRRAGPSPALQVLARRAERRPLSRASPALAVSTSAAAPVAAAALRGEAVGDRGRGVVVRRQRGVGVGEVAVAEAGDRVGRDLAADEEGGTVRRRPGRPGFRCRVSRGGRRWM